jgi:hypothetical protein
MPLELSPGAPLVLGAFVARNGPLDHFIRLRRTAPNPPKMHFLKILTNSKLSGF